MLEKQIVIGLVTILQDMSMQVREDTVVLEDGVELSRTYFRYVVLPDEDVSGRAQIVKDLAGLLWTADVVEAAKVRRQEIFDRLPRLS